MTTTRRDFLKIGSATAATAGAAGLTGCTSGLGSTQPGTVKVSSVRTPESILLSYMALVSLWENTNLNVLNNTALGGTPMNFNPWLFTGHLSGVLSPRQSRG